MDAADLKRTIREWQDAGWVAELHRLVVAAKTGPPDRMTIRMLNVRAAVMAERGREAEAIADWRRSLELDVMQPSVRQDLSAALARRGHIGPDDDESFGLSLSLAQTAVDAGSGVPDRAPVEFMRRLFDRLAPAYEGTMTNDQDYAGPATLAAMVAPVIDPDGVATALDAGCGTGLAAPYLRPLARRLDGTDISPAMLEAARSKSLYDRLEAADLPEFLTRHPDEYDLIFCVGVLGAFGDLEPVIEAAARSLRSGGVLALTADAHCQDDAYRMSGNHFQLYTHSPEAMRGKLRDHGLSIIRCHEYVDRMVAGHAEQPIAVGAVAVTARRSASERA